MITKQHPNLLEDVEKLLLVWINQKQLKGNSVFEGITCAKAKALYVDLVRKTPGTSSKEVLIMWEKVQNFVKKHHPNKAVSGQCMN